MGATSWRFKSSYPHHKRKDTALCGVFSFACVANWLLRRHRVFRFCGAKCGVQPQENTLGARRACVLESSSPLTRTIAKGHGNRRALLLWRGKEIENRHRVFRFCDSKMRRLAARKHSWSTQGVRIGEFKSSRYGEGNGIGSCPPKIIIYEENRKSKQLSW